MNKSNKSYLCNKFLSDIEKVEIFKLKSILGITDKQEISKEKLIRIIKKCMIFPLCDVKMEFLRVNESLIEISSVNWEKKDKVAAFDLDNTIIKTKSGRTFAKDYTDWVLFSDEVTEDLKELHQNDFCIVFISNQKGISKNKPNVEDFQKKINSISELISVPFLLLASLKDDNYRKPAIGMWNHLKVINKKDSFYVGDASGRKKDFSDSDIKFAINIGIDFYTPEQFFLNQKNKEKYTLDFDPTSLLDNNKFSFIKTKEQQVVLFVGFPGSGKTSFYNFYFKPLGFIHINQDTLKTKAKCEKEYKKELNNGSSIVVDNTNPNIEKRKFFIDLAKEKGLQVTCVNFDFTMREAQHINNYRSKKGGRNVPIVTYRVFRKKFEVPSLNENFDEIFNVRFIPNFSSKEDKILFLELS